MGLGTSYNNTINALSVQQEPHYKRVQVEVKLKYSVKVNSSCSTCATHRLICDGIR